MASGNSSLQFNLTDSEIGILCIVNVIFSVVGSFGNVLVCFAFLRLPKLQNTTNIFIVSLACSDLLVCLVAQPMYVVSLIKKYQQQQVTNIFEKVRKCFAWISMLASAGSLLGVTLDRYQAVSKPFRYHKQRLDRRNSYIFVTVVWFVAMGLGISAIFEGIVKKVILVYAFSTVVLLILPLYTKILLIAAKQRRKILISQCHASKSSERAETSSRFTKQRLKLRHKLDRSALITLEVICVVFVLGWFPLLIIPLIYRLARGDSKLILGIFQWVNTLALCCSACNPIVYAATDKQFRESLKVRGRRWVTQRQDFLHGSKSSRCGKRSKESS